MNIEYYWKLEHIAGPANDTQLVSLLVISLYAELSCKDVGTDIWVFCIILLSSCALLTNFN